MPNCMKRNSIGKKSSPHLPPPKYDEKNWNEHSAIKSSDLGEVPVKAVGGMVSCMKRSLEERGCK